MFALGTFSLATEFLVYWQIHFRMTFDLFLSVSDCVLIGQSVQTLDRDVTNTVNIGRLKILTRRRETSLSFTMMTQNMNCEFELAMN